MFDDPKMALERLQEELEAVEKTDDEFERFYSELYAEFGPKQEAVEEKEEDTDDLLKDVPVRRIPGPYDKPAAHSSYADHHHGRGHEKQELSSGVLLLLIVLELLGIGFIAAWWILRLIG